MQSGALEIGRHWKISSAVGSLTAWRRVGFLLAQGAPNFNTIRPHRDDANTAAFIDDSSSPAAAVCGASGKDVLLAMVLPQLQDGYTMEFFR
jgi:hypothetical protein